MNGNFDFQQNEKYLKTVNAFRKFKPEKFELFAFVYLWLSSNICLLSSKVTKKFCHRVVKICFFYRIMINLAAKDPDSLFFILEIISLVSLTPSNKFKFDFKLTNVGRIWWQTGSVHIHPYPLHLDICFVGSSTSHRTGPASGQIRSWRETSMATNNSIQWFSVFGKFAI